MATALHTSSLTSLPLLARGKVRDNYAVGDDRILMVASDRISAFDVIMGEPIPGKGVLLTQMALFWFKKLGHICPNHLTGDAPESVVHADEMSQVTGRAMLVKRLQPIPIEAVVRGYLAGSGWQEYQASQSVCGVPLPKGLHNASRLPESIFTPAAKAAMGEPIPGKGVLLTQMALFWFKKLGHICPNHLTLEAPESVVHADEVQQVTGRAMLVKRLQPIPIEAVVRGYLAGSGWQEYQVSQSVCGVSLPKGLHNASRLPESIFTPAAKAAMGEHDENITFEQTVERIGAPLAEKIRTISIALYETARDVAAAKGIIIADTKFEFGLDPNSNLVLMDEVLTPDSSRYWPADSYQVGVNPPSYDKQFLRDWLETAQVQGKPWSKSPPAPHLPEDVIAQTAAKYQEAWERLKD